VVVPAMPAEGVDNIDTQPALRQLLRGYSCAVGGALFAIDEAKFLPASARTSLQEYEVTRIAASKWR